MTATDAQVRMIMREREKGRTQEQAAARANLSRKTAAKYERLGQMPGHLPKQMPRTLKRSRTYRTRADSFAKDWAVLEEMLIAAPELEANALFEWLCDQHPGQWQGTGFLASRVPEKLQAMAGMIGAIFRQARGQFPILLEFWTPAQRDPVLWEATIVPYRRYRGLFAAMIEEGIAQNDLRPVDPDLAAQVVVSLAMGLLLQGLLDPEGADWGQTAQESVHLLLAGLERRWLDERSVDRRIRERRDQRIAGADPAGARGAMFRCANPGQPEESQGVQESDGRDVG